MPVLYLLTFVLLIALFAVAERFYRAHRRAMYQSRRRWFEYAQLADQRAEELRGR